MQKDNNALGLARVHPKRPGDAASAAVNVLGGLHSLEGHLNLTRKSRMKSTKGATKPKT